MKFDDEKVKIFIEDALRDYKQNLRVNGLCNFKETEKTDGSFIQIGIRPLVDANMLLPDKNGVAFDPRLPAIGMNVAVGEQDFLIKNILNEKEIKRVKIDELKEFPKEIYDFDKPHILISLKFFVEIHKIFSNRIKYENGNTLLDFNYKLDFIPENDLGNRIIIIDKNAIVWQKKKFKNEITGTEENLDIKIKSHDFDKVDILVRSVNKVNIVDREGIKILEIEENGEKS